MQEPTDDGPTGQLNPFTDDCREIFHRALERVGYPSESVAALRRYGDPRPRRRLPDGTEVVVQWVPPLPPRDRLYVAFGRLVAEQVGCPISSWHREAFSREMEALGGELAVAILACDYGDVEAAEKIKEAVSGLREIRYGDETWAERASQVWRAFRQAIGGALVRHVMGAGHRRGETKGHVDVERRLCVNVPESLVTRPVIETPAWRRAEIREQFLEAGMAMLDEMPKTAHAFLARHIDELEYSEIVDTGIAPTEDAARKAVSRAYEWIRQNRPELGEFMAA